MNEYDEIRESVRAEYGATVSSKLVDDRLKETYESLGVMARAQKRSGNRALKWAGGLAGGLAAAFAVTVGVSAANPAFAASIPGMQGIVSFLKGGPVSNSLIDGGGVDQFITPLAKPEEEQQLRITETYYDGGTLILGMELRLENAPETYRQLDCACSLTAKVGGQETAIDREGRQPAGRTPQCRMVRTDEATYVGSITLDAAWLDLPDAFDLTVKLDKVTAIDTKLFVLSEVGGYTEKTYDVDLENVEAACTVEADPSLQRVYAVNETKNGCTLKQIVSTPALTQIGIALEEDGVVMFAYDDEGKELTGMPQYGGDYKNQYFTALKKDAQSVTVKFFRREDRYHILAEFVVPVEGGFAADTVSPWEGDNVPVVYDPPRKQADTNTRNRKGTQVVELGETFQDTYGMLSGSMDVTFDNLRVYGSYEDAGISREELRDESVAEHMESGGYRFVLLDITLEGRDAIASVNAEEESNQEAMSEDGTYWISSFAYPCPVDGAMTGGGDAYIGTEVDYFSEHSNGGTNYYHFKMNANETKTMQIGFAVPADQLEQGNFQIACDMGGNAGLTEEEMMHSMLGSSTYCLVNIPADAVKAAIQ